MSTENTGKKKTYNNPFCKLVEDPMNDTVLKYLKSLQSESKDDITIIFNGRQMEVKLVGIEELFVRFSFKSGKYASPIIPVRNVLLPEDFVFSLANPS